MISPEIEKDVYGLIRTKGIRMGVTVFEVNGMPDHVHVVTTLPPKIAASELIRQLKGFSAFKINEKRLTQSLFQWQAEYGAFTFDEKRLPFVVEYVKRQKENHATGRTIRLLERDSEVPRSDLCEATRLYDFPALEAEWYREMKELPAGRVEPGKPQNEDHDDPVGIPDGPDGPDRPKE